MAIQRYGKMFFFSTTFMLVGLHVATWMGSDRSFSVRHVEVTGCYMLQPEEVVDAANVRLSTPILNIDVRAVRERVQKMPLVQSASVARQFPSTLAIRIQEVSAVALLNHNGLQPIDEQGHVLPMPRRSSVLDLPIVSGLTSAPLTSGQKVSGAGERVIEYLCTVRKYNAALYHNISEVQLSANGGLVLYLMDQAVPVRMGKDQWMEKSERLMIVLQHLKTHPGVVQVAEFDLRFPGQVIAKNRT